MPATPRNVLRLCLLGGLGLGCASTPPPPVSPPPEAATVAARSSPEKIVRDLPPAAFADPDRRQKIDATFPEIREQIARIVAADQIVGLAVGIVVDGELVLGDGFGVRHAEQGGAIDTRTAFRIGSITKIFTAMTALRLADEGRLDLDQPAAVQLPELHTLVYPAADARRLTVRDILTHTSGLPRNPDLAPLVTDLAPTRDQLMQAIDGLSLTRPPGLTYEYSNLGFSLLGHIVAAASGRPYHDTIRDAVLDPLGMKHTVWELTAVPPARLATGHTVTDADIVAWPPTRHGALDAAGGLFSTVDDLARFVAFQLDAWPSRSDNDPGPLPRTTLREAQRVQAFRGFHARTVPVELAPGGVEGGSSGVGFTWGVTHGCQHSHTVGHNGATDGYHATIRMLPSAGIGIIVLGNAGWANTDHIADTIQRALDRGGALDKRLPTPLPAVDDAAHRVLDLFSSQWDPDAFAERSTLALRQAPARAHIAERMHWLRNALGPCTLGPLKRPTSAWSGLYNVQCERGGAELTLALTTARAPKISGIDLNWTGGTPTAPVTAAAAAAIALLDHFDDTNFRALFTPDYTRTTFDNLRARLRFEHGVCRLDRPLEVSGPDAAVFALKCDSGGAKLALTLDRGSSTQIRAFRITSTGDLPACR